MRTRGRELRCNTCDRPVARGVATDDSTVREISLDDTVTEAFALHNGMMYWNFNSAKVNHTEDNGNVTHTITTHTSS